MALCAGVATAPTVVICGKDAVEQAATLALLRAAWAVHTSRATAECARWAAVAALQGWWSARTGVSDDAVAFTPEVVMLSYAHQSPNRTCLATVLVVVMEPRGPVAAPFAPYRAAATAPP